MTAPIALTIAGSDSGGGAGMQADLKTFSALGVYGASVITALTAQNTREVAAICEVSSEFVTAQLNAVIGDLDVAAIKIGMLHRTAVIAAVADALTSSGIGHLVLDPVMVAKSGDPLLEDEAVDALKSRLIPLASIITPNIPEAARLLRRKVEYVQSNMELAAERLLGLGCGAVLLKGGHSNCPDASVDFYHDGNVLQTLSSQRIETDNTHGTGCTLSAAICAHLAKREGLGAAVTLAKQFIGEAIAAADHLQIGRGHGPVHHFYQHWKT